MPAVQSSAIRAIRHDREKSELLVTFVTGRSFAYAGVPAALYEAFLAAPSKGRFFNEAIRDRFPCREVSARRARAR